MRWFRPPLLWDVLAAIGLTLATTGAALVWAPLGLLMLGGSVLLLGLWGAAAHGGGSRKRRRGREQVRNLMMGKGHLCDGSEDDF